MVRINPLKFKKFQPVRIGIIGYGIVGQAIGEGFSLVSKKRDEIRYYDKYKESDTLEKVVEESDFIFITLPTPMKKDESGIDLSTMDEMMTQITPLTDYTDKIIIIKSTVIPGTTLKYQLMYPRSNFCFNPEFLTEAKATDDFINASRTIIGSNNPFVSKKVAKFFKERFSQSEIFLTDLTTAETVKYFINTFLAMKVSFANIMYDLCQVLSINYDVVKSLAAADPRIVDAHLDVTAERGFGGKCFPKDLVAIKGLGAELAIDMVVFDAVWHYNKRIRSGHDWHDIPFAVRDPNEN
jgi:nucleotide sugar dehydrogenase